MNQRKYKRGLAALAVLALGVGVTACGGSDSGTDTTAAAGSDTTMASEGGTTLANFTPTEGAKAVDCRPTDGSAFKAAWIYVGPITDGGWTQAHHEGYKAAVAEFGDKLVATYKENMPEGPEVAATIDQLVKDGNNMIFGTSFGFQDAFFESAAKYPNVCFEMETGYKFQPNMSEAYGAGEDGDYLAGIAAGAASKSGKVGAVMPFAIPEVIRGLNAFTLGVRKSNPDATVQVTWTSTWFDPAKERQAAESLISAGVDALWSAQDSPAAGDAAKEKGVKWVGYDSDQNANYPEIWLTATTYHWAVYEVPRIAQAMAGEWVPGDYYGGLDDGFVKLASFGKSVSAETQAVIAEEMAKLKETKGAMFTGPINKQDGTVAIEAGKTASYGEKMSMDYLIEGVVGDLPKS